VAFKIRQNRFSAGALPRAPLWGSSRRSPYLLVGSEVYTPSHTLLHSAPTDLRRSPCVPQNSSQIYAYGYDYQYMYNVQCTDYGVGVTGNYWGHLDCQELRAPQYLNPALSETLCWKLEHSVKMLK